MPQEIAEAAKPVLESEHSRSRVRVSFPDEDWRERIERAKQARRDGQIARQGKPLTFRTQPSIG